MRQRVAAGWSKLLAEAKKLSARELAAFKNALDAHCAQMLVEQEQGVIDLRGAISAKPRPARKSTRRRARRARRAAPPARAARKRAAKPVAAKKGAPRRGRAGAAEAKALIANALTKRPSTISELVKESGCVRITVDKYIKKGLKTGKIVQAGVRGRAVLYKAR
jgi:DNA invertase Pin-like site-specific DNA recombinase